MRRSANTSGALRSGRTALISFVFFLMSSYQAFAQSGGPPVELAMAGDEMMLFQEIPSVYGASKYEQKVTEAPSSVSIVTAGEIKKYGYRTLADILRSVRSFYVTYDRNYAYVGVRGFNRPGDYNSRVLLLVDGHRVNDNIYDQAAIGTEFVLDVDLIDRVEVIRGPGSSLYGSNAFFAVVNVITKRGRDLSGVEASGEAASYKTYKGRVSYGEKTAGGTEVLLSGTFSDSRGQRLYYREFDQRLAGVDPRAANNGIAEDADGDRFYSSFLKTAYKDVTVTAALSSRTKEIPTASFGTDFYDPRNKTTDAHSYVDLNYVHGLGSRTDLTVRLFYDYYHYWGDYLYGGITNKDRGAGAWWGGEVKLLTRFLDAHRLIAGAEYQGNREQNQENYDAVPYYIYLEDKRATDRNAVYVQDELTLSRSLLLTVGGRYDHYETFGGTTNPRAALIYTPLEGATVKLLYGSAFRAPNAYELYYAAPTAVPPMAPNPNLNPEKIKTSELIFEQYLGDHLRATVGGYYYTINDLIDQTIDAGGNMLFENIEKVRSRGIEAELENKWSGGLEARASYSYQRSLDVATGARLSNSPKHLTKINLLSPVPGGLAAGVEGQYTSPRTTPAGGRLGGFLVANLTLLSRDLADGLELSASVYNLFDKEYADPVSGDFVQDSLLQDGRSFRVKATYKF